MFQVLFTNCPFKGVLSTNPRSVFVQVWLARRIRPWSAREIAALQPPRHEPAGPEKAAKDGVGGGLVVLVGTEMLCQSLPKPRNPRHFDIIEGGRDSVSDTSCT